MYKTIVISTLAISLILSGCAPAVASHSPVPTLTTAFAASVTPAQTSTPEAEVTPEPVLGPEQPAVSVEQVVGLWRMRLAGGGENDPAIFTLRPDGTWSVDGVGGYHEGMNLGVGTYAFEGDVFSMTSDACLNTSAGSQEFYTCTATYHVFVAMAEGRPGSLRFVAIDDPYIDRRNGMNNKTLLPASVP
jgi:hypothetical protein